MPVFLCCIAIACCGLDVVFVQGYSSCFVFFFFLFGVFFFYYVVDDEFNRCNLCRSRIKFYGYRCPDCSFDVCSSCYKKHVKMLQEKENEKKQQKSLTNVSKKSDKLSKNGNNKVDMSKGGNFKFNVYDGATGKDNKNVASIEKSHTQEELSNRKYIMRAAKLCKPHLKILILAFVCLAINSGSNLLLPSSQGAILDKIVDLV